MKRISISIETLEIIKEISGGKTLTQCARDHGIGKSAISTRIKEAESELAHPLFDRKRQRLSPTPFVIQILPEITGILENFERIAKMAAKAPKSSRIRCSFPQVLLDLFYYRIDTYLRNHPELELVQNWEGERDLEEMILTEDVDCAFVGNPRHLSELHSSFLFSSRAGFLVHSNHPFAGKEIISTEEIRDCQVFMGKEMNNFARKNLGGRIRFVKDNIPANAYCDYSRNKDVVFTFGFVAKMLDDPRHVFVPAEGLSLNEIYLCWLPEKDAIIQETGIVDEVKRFIEDVSAGK